MAAHQAPRPWDSPGKNTGVGCHFLLQCMKVKSESEVAQSCPTLSDPMNCSPAGSSIPWDFPGKSTGVGCHRQYSGLISFRIDWFDLAVQGTLKSLLQHHTTKASILRCSAFFIVQLSHLYMTTGKIIGLTKQTFVGKVMMEKEREKLCTISKNKTRS